MSRVRLRSGVLVLGLTVLCCTAAAASAHPGAPFKSVAWAKSVAFHPGKGEFDDRSASCRGIGAHQGPLYRHFQCSVTRNDGTRFSMIVHSGNTGSDLPIDFLDVTHGDAYRKTVLASKTVQGDYGTVVLSGTVTKPGPAGLMARFFVAPDQKVRGNWSVVCHDATSAASSKGSFTAYDLTDVQLKFPVSLTYSASSCTGAVSASLVGSGRLTVKLIGYSR